MNSRFKVAAIAFGMYEFCLGTILSVFIWMSPSISSSINIKILAATLLITVWQFFNRKKALAYLTGLAARVFFLASIFVLSQIGSIVFEKFDDSIKLYWLVLTIVIFIAAMIQHIILEKRNWAKTLQVWRDIGKINIEQRYFKIVGMFHDDPLPAKPRIISSMGVYTLIGILGLKFIFERFGEDGIGAVIEDIILHSGLIMIGYFCMMFIGKIVVWIIELAKVEKELGVTFVTEYGRQEK